MRHASRILPLLLIAAASCTSAPAAHRLGEYDALQPMFTTPQSEKTPTQMTVNLRDPGFAAVLFVVPGRGSALVYPSDSVMSNHLESGRTVIPIRFTEQPFNRDSVLAVLNRRRDGNTRRLPRDSAARDSALSRIGSLRDPGPAGSPIGYLLLVASRDSIPYSMLKRRVENVTIPIDDDEALSTVMKLVKASIREGATLSGYAAELDRL